MRKRRLKVSPDWLRNNSLEKPNKVITTNAAILIQTTVILYQYYRLHYVYPQMTRVRVSL